MYPNPADPRGYAHFNTDRCEAGGNVCTAQWDIGPNYVPSMDGEPLPLSGVTFIPGSVVTGHWE